MTREQQILSLAGIVHGAARRYPGDTDDLHQAAWIGAIRAVDTWDGHGALTGWAWGIIHNEIARHLRDSAPKNGCGGVAKWQPLRPGERATLVPLEDEHTRHDNEIENAPARIDARRLLDRLEPRDRAIVILLSEYTQREVATALGCGQATIGRVVARVREAA